MGFGLVMVIGVEPPPFLMPTRGSTPSANASAAEPPNNAKARTNRAIFTFSPVHTPTDWDKTTCRKYAISLPDVRPLRRHDLFVTFGLTVSPIPKQFRMCNLFLNLAANLLRLRKHTKGRLCPAATTVGHSAFALSSPVQLKIHRRRARF